MRTVEMTDIFGEPLVVRISEAKRKPTEPKGYAAVPGTGPAGETCRSCRHKVASNWTAKRYLKCALMQAHWTGGPGTDIRAGSPACARWEKKE